MRNSVDTQWLTLRLVECEAVYRTGRSPEEMLLLADIWAQDLEGQDKDDVGRAFVMHRQESSRFPCPADILRLLPRCRMTARMESPMALPVDTVSYNRRAGTWPSCSCKPCTETARPRTRWNACGCSRGEPCRDEVFGLYSWAPG